MQNRLGITVTGLTKSFGDTVALAGVDLDAQPGQVLGLLGPNGAGKTTLINVLSTLVAPDGGVATVAGHDVVTDAAAVRQAIALTGQFAAVDDVLTGQENLELFGRLRGLARRDAKRRANDLLQQFSLGDAAARRVGTYSGGMRRRLDIAVSLVVPVPVLFLDEPTTGLDPRSRVDVWDAVRDLRRSGMTVVLTTQYLEEADRLADSIVVIDKGSVVARGTPDELKARAGGRSCVVTPVLARDIDKARAALASLGRTAVDEDAGTLAVADVGPEQIVDVVDALGAAGIEVMDIALRRPTLDEVFLQLTGAQP